MDFTKPFSLKLYNKKDVIARIKASARKVKKSTLLIKHQQHHITINDIPLDCKYRYWYVRLSLIKYLLRRYKATRIKTMERDGAVVQTMHIIPSYLVGALTEIANCTAPKLFGMLIPCLHFKLIPVLDDDRFFSVKFYSHYVIIKLGIYDSIRYPLINKQVQLLSRYMSSSNAKFNFPDIDDPVILLSLLFYWKLQNLQRTPELDKWIESTLHFLPQYLKIISYMWRRETFWVFATFLKIAVKKRILYSCVASMIQGSVESRMFFKILKRARSSPVYLSRYFLK